MFSGPTSRAVGRLKEEEEEEEDDETGVLPISIPDSVLATLGYFVDKRPLQKHSKLSKKH